MGTNIEMAVLPKYKVVVDAAVARRLLKDGFKVADIKPKKGQENESVFIFEVVPGFVEKMRIYSSEHRKREQIKE